MRKIGDGVRIKYGVATIKNEDLVQSSFLYTVSLSSSGR